MNTLSKGICRTSSSSSSLISPTGLLCRAALSAALPRAQFSIGCEQSQEGVIPFFLHLPPLLNLCRSTLVDRRAVRFSSLQNRPALTRWLPRTYKSVCSVASSANSATLKEPTEPATNATGGRSVQPHNNEQRLRIFLFLIDQIGQITVGQTSSTLAGIAPPAAPLPRGRLQ